MPRVARLLAEMGLRSFMQPAAERLGVRCRQGQWWLPDARDGTEAGQ
jgi:hypothetical protein